MLRDRTSELECSHKDLKAQVIEMRDLLKLLGGAVRRNSKVVIADNVDEYFPTEHTTDYSPSDILCGRPSPRLSLISETTADSLLAGSVPPAESLDESQDFISTSVRPSEDEAFKSLNVDSGSPVSPASTLVYPIPFNTFLPKDSFPSPEVSAQYSEGIEYVLKTVGPYERQLAQRQSALAWLKRQVRIALGTAGFEGGLHATNCLLPEDSFRLNLAISKGLLANWHILLCERLHSQIDKANAYGGTLFIPPDEEDNNLDPFFQEANISPANHSLGPVYHNKNNMSHTVYLTIDNLPVEIVANSRTDFCWQALVEEVDELVGQQHVFKKTFLLVRTWWAYETPSYVGTSIRHYLTDHQLLIMLLSVFNRYWEHITSPLQALLLFFTEFTAYDGSHQVITLQGIVPFQTRASSQPNSIEVKPFHYLNSAFVEKYWQVFNVNVTIEMDTGTSQKRPSSSSEEPAEAQTSNTEPKASPTHGPPPSPQHHRHSDPAITKATLVHLSINNLHHFDRSAFNILHPFTHTNMITERLSARRVNRIVKAFQTGISNLLFYMKRVTDNGLNPVEAICSFFPGVFQAYKGRLPSYDGASVQELL
ncbi:hypothetical protein EON65_27130 [archaeon]|nr:MAG: hypothetical protein EON65_27130 [archaeon]